MTPASRVNQNVGKTKIKREVAQIATSKTIENPARPDSAKVEENSQVDSNLGKIR